jgi:hypothetical protein
MGSPKAGGEYEIAHIGGAKTIRLAGLAPRRLLTLPLGVLDFASKNALSGAGMHHDRLG